MAQSLRTFTNRKSYQFVYLDHPGRGQALPLVIVELLNYLFTLSSLSQMLREKSQFRVKTLDIVEDLRSMWVRRDVAIYGGQTLRWYARTEIQASSLQGMNWGHRGSLGDFLFSAQGIQRKNLTLRKVSELPFASITSRAWYWVRQSHWQLKDPCMEFVILEFF